jgi:hypothetical protein
MIRIHLILMDPDREWGPDPGAKKLTKLGHKTCLRRDKSLQKGWKSVLFVNLI